jgi:hypothetical protein
VGRAIDLAPHSPSAREIDDNLIWRLLRDAGVDWCASIATLKTRYGTTFDHAYERSVVQIPVSQPPLGGLFKPLSISEYTDQARSLPPAMFSCVYFDEPETVAPASRGGFLERFWASNIRPWTNTDGVCETVFHRAVAKFSHVLGAGVDGAASNTLGRRWDVGPASVELTSWPRQLNERYGPNAIHEREPRLAAACLVNIRPGFSLIANADDMRVVKSMRLIAPPAIATLEDVSAAHDSHLNFVREFLYRISPTLRASTHVGDHGDAAKIGIAERDSLLLLTAVDRMLRIPLADIRAVVVTRVQPARFSGYAQVSVQCVSDFGNGPLRRIALMSAPAADDLTEYGKRFAEELQQPCVINEYTTED